jgi:hypothetical protein
MNSLKETTTGTVDVDDLWRTVFNQNDIPSPLRVGFFANCCHHARDSIIILPQ